MRAVIQRVIEASCTVNGMPTGIISTGLVVLLGIENADTKEDVVWLAGKIASLRIFSDENGLMNKSLNDVQGNVLLISQFTLFAQTRTGNRPGFTRAARPETAIPLYELMISNLEISLNKSITCGIFGADMQINLINDGPVTIIMDTKDRENH